MQYDLNAMWCLNQESAAETSSLTLEAFELLTRKALHVGVVANGTTGFLIALGPDADYDNENYHWLCRRYDQFVYIDRVVVATVARRQGIAARLYAELAIAARTAGHRHLACEVNIAPPNPSSEAFHVRQGFAPVGLAQLKNGKRVQYWLRDL
jgi:predicted GNAT superfamily acetyltransferase